MDMGYKPYWYGSMQWAPLQNIGFLLVGEMNKVRASPVEQLSTLDVSITISLTRILWFFKTKLLMSVAISCVSILHMD